MSATGPKNTSATTSADRPDSRGSTVSCLSSRSTFHDDFARSIEFCSRPTASSSGGLRDGLLGLSAYRRTELRPDARATVHRPVDRARFTEIAGSSAGGPSVGSDRCDALRNRHAVDALRSALGGDPGGDPVRSCARARQPHRRPHRLPGRALPADRDRPRRADRVPAATDGELHVRSLDLDADDRRDGTPGRVRSPRPSRCSHGSRRRRSRASTPRSRRPCRSARAVVERGVRGRARDRDRRRRPACASARPSSRSLAQEVEQRASGVPCGVMDQLASVAGGPGTRCCSTAARSRSRRSRCRRRSGCS